MNLGWQWVIRPWAVSIALLFAASSAAVRVKASESGGEYDRWDSDRSTSVEAKFLGFQSGHVRLQSRDGKIISVDFLKLSPESRGQALKKAAVPEGVARLIQRIADARLDALALLKDRVDKATEDLEAASAARSRTLPQ